MSFIPVESGRALLLIDLQRWIVEMGLAPRSGTSVLRGCAALRDTFEQLGAPVVFIKHVRSGHPPGPGDEWLAEVAPSPRDPVVLKSGLDAFAQTDLHDVLRGLRIRHLTVAGIATAHGVLSTVLSALGHGYTVTVAADATTSLDTTEHQVALQTMASAGATINAA